MGRIFVLHIVLSVVLYTTSSSAQVSLQQDSSNTVRKLFNESYPATIAYSTSEIDKLFRLKKGGSFTLTSCKKLVIKGTVNNVITNSDGVKSISLKPGSLANGTRMVIIRGSNEGKIEYSGFIINYNFPDAYKITSSANGFIIFSQMERKEIIEE